MIFQQQYLFWLAGLSLLGVAVVSWRDRANPRRNTTALFWGIYGLLFLVGDWAISLAGGGAHGARRVHILAGAAVVLLALLAGCGGLRRGHYPELSQQQRQRGAQRLGNRLFLPALAIPLVTVAGVLLFNNLPGLQLALFGPGNHATLVTLFSMSVGCLVALALALKVTREAPQQTLHETRRLLDAIGWAFILPQVLATLGLLFTAAGVGESIAWLTRHWLAVDSRLVAVLAYTFGMALLTMIMGNAFAAFPIITAGIGIPILVVQHGGNPAVMAAIGMFSGYCGTLMTPMAANFNIVPAALLELPDKYGVIKAQIPTGLALLIANTLLLWLLMFL